MYTDTVLSKIHMRAITAHRSSRDRLTSAGGVQGRHQRASTLDPDGHWQSVGGASHKDASLTENDNLMKRFWAAVGSPEKVI